jgi:Predicted Fe-S oxidoreductases
MATTMPTKGPDTPANIADVLFHPPGALSPSGVLDVGLKCAHSCRFCYYSFMAEAKAGADGKAGQFDALRHASFRSTEDCLAIIDRMAEGGLVNFDITGGEPTMHEGLPDMVRRAVARGMSVRVITLGQFLLGKAPGHPGQRLLDTLLDAGVTDFLFSLHSSTEDGFREATRGSLQKVLAAMDELDAKGFQYAANTVVHAGNVHELPAIAELAAAHGVYHHNFIVFNAYYRWDSPASIAGLQAPYTAIAGPLTRAVGILDAAGAAVTVRYLPLCAAPELARHIVGVVGVHHDPHEWMNRAGNPDREPDYCAEVLPVPADGPRDIYALKRGAHSLDFGPAGTVETVAVRGDDFKVFPPLCADCAAMPYCDGLDPKYVLLHGVAGLAPFAHMPGSEPLVQARREYLPAFVLKRRPQADMRAAIARLREHPQG